MYGWLADRHPGATQAHYCSALPPPKLPSAHAAAGLPASSFPAQGLPAHRLLRTLALLLLTAALASCASFSSPPFPEPLRPPLSETEQQAGAAAAEEGAEPPAKYSSTPDVHITKTQASGVADDLGASLQGPPIKAAFNGVPIVAFISEVFGNQLGLSFVITPDLQGKRDLVTLRLADPVPPSQFFETARQVLREYGVTIREDDGVLTFTASQEITSSEIPLLISGRTLPEVPATHRTVFHLVPLMAAETNHVVSMLREAFPRKVLDISDEPQRNTVLLQGPQKLVAQALELIEVLDQPLLRGKHGLIVKPEFLLPEALAEVLEEVLRAQGYNAGGRSGHIIFLPFDDLGKLVIFAQGDELLELTKTWIERFDNAQSSDIDRGLFTYEVKETQVADIVGTLGQLVGNGQTSARSSGSADGSGSQPRQGGQDAHSITSGGGHSLVVDEKRNMLIFRGSGEDWAEILKVVKQLDKPVPSVLIEVLIAEISLSDEEGSGFDFLFKGGLDRFGISGGTGGRLGISNQGLSLTLDSGGQVRAMLDLFYEDSRVSIRSQPKLLVKSGEQANIEVGNEIPIITKISEGSVELLGSSNILQEVSYRSTGVSLSITPIVQAGGLVDITIDQRLSEARPTAATSFGGSPTILNRRLSSSLTLKDGSSLLMGGLISESNSVGQTGVPGLGRLPLLGRLFRVDSAQVDRTELMVMVTPYVVRDHEEGAKLTEQIKSKLQLHKRFIKR